MEFINDESSSNDINISNAMDWALLNKEVVTNNDPFTIDVEGLKKVGGLSTSFKRKMNREFTKRFTGQSGTGTQQNLLAQAITGYAMFDLIEPPN